MEYLFSVERELYTIKLLNRENGYNAGSYRIITDEDYKLYESSPRKILLRLINTFSLYWDDFNENEINNIINDLAILANKLKIPEHFAKTQMLKLRSRERRYKLK